MNYVLLNIDYNGLLDLIVTRRIPWVVVEEDGPASATLLLQDNPLERTKLMISIGSNLNLPPDDVVVHSVPHRIALSKRVDTKHCWFSHPEGDPVAILSRIVDALIELGVEAIYFDEQDRQYYIANNE